VELVTMQRRLTQARVAHLATVSADGHPHVVPACFAFDGRRIVSAVDHKRKTTSELRRITNIRANPAVSLLVDHYDEDWKHLWWVRVDGRARIVDGSHDDYERVITPLYDKYRGQYGLHAPAGPAILVEPQHWRGWSATV
jgi:PPOX class probable F420-dependent enzyme